jgi:hypothetical protein
MQQGICPVCHQPLENGKDLHIHHVIPKKSEGKDDLANLWLVGAAGNTGEPARGAEVLSGGVGHRSDV